MDLPLSCNPAGVTEDGRCAVSLVVVSRLSITNPSLISYQNFPSLEAFVIFPP